MGYDEVREIIRSSERGDWNVISCLNTPSYLSWNPVEANKHPGDYNEHLARAAFRADISLGLAWGITVNEDFREEFAQSFANERAQSFIADVLYNGMLVSREYLVVVDGGRCYLPIPRMGHESRVTKWDHDFARLLDALQVEDGVGGGLGSAPSRSEFDDYFRRSGLTIAD